MTGSGRRFFGFQDASDSGLRVVGVGGAGLSQLVRDPVPLAELELTRLFLAFERSRFAI